MGKKFIISAFIDEAIKDINQQMPLLNKLGIEYFEPRYVAPDRTIDSYTNEEAKELKKMMDDHGVKASCIGSSLGKQEITDDFNLHIEKLKRCSEIAHIIGTNQVRTFSFWIPEGTDRAQWRDEVFSRLNKLVEIAKEENIVLLHENEHRIYGESPEDCLDIFNTIKSSHLSGTFDPANFVYFGYETFAAYNLLKDHITYFHMKDAVPQVEMRPVGCGEGRVPEILSAVPERDKPYFLTIEPHIGEFQGIENHVDDALMAEYPDRLVRLFVIAYNALVKVLKDIGQY